MGQASLGCHHQSASGMGAHHCDAPCSQRPAPDRSIHFNSGADFFSSWHSFKPHPSLTHSYFLEQREQPHSTQPLWPPASPQAFSSSSLLQILNCS